VILAVRLAALALLVGVSAPAMAQTQANPARLDDFAVGATHDDPSHVEQLAPADDRPQGSPQPHDRAIATPEPPAPRATALRQVSRPDQPLEQAQLSTAGASPDASPAAVSSTADSRPQGVEHLGGHDRCDPQLAGEELARCQRILELRAQEFNAPAPPQLSAEQKLLAEQRVDDERTGRSPATRLRFASRDTPDADLQSNQELAALYLARQQTPQANASPPEEERTAADASLAQILAGLQIQTGGSSPPP
jgi:hypothetical protein